MKSNQRNLESYLSVDDIDEQHEISQALKMKRADAMTWNLKARKAQQYNYKVCHQK